jgi:chromosome segregation ATPase
MSETLEDLRILTEQLNNRETSLNDAAIVKLLHDGVQAILFSALKAVQESHNEMRTTVAELNSAKNELLLIQRQLQEAQQQLIEVSKELAEARVEIMALKKEIQQASGFSGFSGSSQR